MKNGIVIDIETTGFEPSNHKITEIGAIKIINGKVAEVLNQLVDPEVYIPDNITRLTGISNETVKGMPTIDVVMPSVIDFCEDYPIMGHNILFDYSFLKTNAAYLKLSFEKRGIDTLLLARAFMPSMESRSLSALCDYFDIRRESAHRAYDDAMATYTLYLKLWERYYDENTRHAFAPKPLVYKVPKKEPMTEKQERYLKHLVESYQVVLKKPFNEYTKSEASREIDLIINQYGRRPS